jgi:hypothetical protein
MLGIPLRHVGQWETDRTIPNESQWTGLSSTLRLPNRVFHPNPNT